MSVGARSAAATPFCLLQVLEVNQGEGRKLARCKADPEEDTFDEARLSRSGQQAGSRPKRKTPQVVQEEEDDDGETEDGLVSKRKRVATSTPPTLPTPTPPSPPAPLQPVQATPLAAAPQWLKATALTMWRTLRAPQHRSYLSERVLLQPHLSLGPH